MVRTWFSGLAVLLALAAAAQGADKKAAPVDPGKAQTGMGKEVNGLSAGLEVDRTTFGLLGRMTVIPRGQKGKPEPIYEIFRLTLVLKNSAGQAAAVFRDANAAGAAGAITAEVIGPDGKAVEPLTWAATETPPKPAAASIKAGEEHRLDLTGAFFYDANSDPNYPPPPVMATTALGNKRFCLLKAGTYRIRATYKPATGALAGAWTGEAVTNEVTVTLHAEQPKFPRLAEFTAKAAKGPRLTPKAATFFGSAGIEEFVAVAAQADGTLVAFGNAWGKAAPAPAAAAASVIGKGKWYDVNEFVGGQPHFWNETKVAVSALDREYPNQAGMIVRYSPDLAKVISVARFDWGVAGIDFAAAAPDGSLYISGRCTEQFRSVETAGGMKVVPQPKDHRYGRRFYQGLWLSGDSYVARLSADGTKLQWACVLEGCRQGSRLFVDKDGGVTFDIAGVRHISSDGKALSDIRIGDSPAGVADIRLLSVSPADRTILRGGWRIASTGREMWKQPLLLAQDSAGLASRPLYGWHPGLAGHDDFRLIADSGFAAAAWTPEGTLWLCGWAEGRASVLMRSPGDLERAVPRDEFGMDLAGSEDGSMPVLLHMDPKTRQVKLAAAFAAYGAWRDPRSRQRNDPEDAIKTMSVSHFAVLADGSLAMAGQTEPFLVQTPGALGCSPQYDWKGMPAPSAGGNFVAVFAKDCKTLLFSSVLPAVEITGLCETKTGLAVVGRTAGMSADGAEAARVLNAAQGVYAGGRLDGYILLLEKP